MKYLLDGQETERLLFRKLKHDDFHTWLNFHQDPRTSMYWSGLPQDPIKACKDDFERTFFRYENNFGGKMASSKMVERSYNVIPETVCCDVRVQPHRSSCKEGVILAGRCATHSFFQKKTYIYNMVSFVRYEKYLLEVEVASDDDLEIDAVPVSGPTKQYIM